MSISDCIAVLETHNVKLDPGLTSSEFVEIERRYGFEFSPDHRQLLETVMPIGNGWVDWRNGSEESIRGRLDWPLDGLLFDVEHNSFWPSTWPAKPDTLDEQREVAFGPADLDYYQRESEVGPETCPPWSLLPFELDIVD